MKVAVNHFYKRGNDAWIDIIETDMLPSDLKLKVEQAVLVRLRELPLPGAVMQNEVYNAGGVSEFPMMIMGTLNLIEE
jgi:hypothetical protein